MNRRAFFARLLPGVAVAAAPAAASEPERPLELAGGPICPRCGLHAVMLLPSLAPDPVGRLVPVECGPCNWKGVYQPVRVHQVRRT